MPRTFLLILLVCGYSSTASAFSNFVHDLICEVAYDLASPAAKTMVDDIRTRSSVAGTNTPFGEACVWPDDSRRNTHRETREYHFVNVPRAESIDLAKNCSRFDCTTQAIIRYAQELSDPNTSTQNRKEALLFVGHFVADLHQPLHVGNAEDLGGNAITVFTSATDGTANTKLHAVWDSNIPKKLKMHWDNAEQTLGNDISNASTASWKTESVSTWAEEAHALARSHAYKLPNGSAVQDNSRLTDPYYDAAKPILQEQVMKAAVRLAHLLDLAAQNNIKHDTLD